MVKLLFHVKILSILGMDEDPPFLDIDKEDALDAIKRDSSTVIFEKTYLENNLKKYHLLLLYL